MDLEVSLSVYGSMLASLQLAPTEEVFSEGYKSVIEIVDIHSEIAVGLWRHTEVFYFINKRFLDLEIKEGF